MKKISRLLNTGNLMPKEIENKSIESWIRDAACSIHGAVDAPKYKDFIFFDRFPKEAGYQGNKTDWGWTKSNSKYH
jgi:hypothetical protein